MDKSEQINELATALAKAQGAITPAIKDSNNPFFKSQYADLASVWDACRKPLSENGLSVVQTIDGNDKLETTLLHSSGQFISSTLSIVAKDQTSQSIGSAITYARRYALSAIIGICPDDDDAEAAMGRPSEPAIGGEVKYTREHWCSVHNVGFFKTKKMKSWAHPIANTKGWCYEPKPISPLKPEDRNAMQTVVAEHEEKPPVETKPDASQSPQNEQGRALEHEVVETATVPAIDMVALRTDMKKAHWPERTAFSWLNGQYKLASIPNDSLGQMLSRIRPEQAAEFVAKMKGMAEAAGEP